MPSGLFSPPGSTAISRLTETPQDYISPSTRRPLAGSPAVTNTLTTMLTTPSVNDDAAERKERRRSKVLELQRRNLNSPATPSNDRRKSLPVNGLSNVQVSEIYSNCIKLSAENKINAKNAFGLHLIDYMSELLKKKEMNNFQVASSTLDASAKIYAGRVDAIHSETYKVLSGLGRGSDKQDNKENIEVDEDGEPIEGQNKENKRKRARKSNTIETNLKNLNVNKFDLEFEIDPLFSKTSAAFDEGGTGGLLLNHLRTLDDASELVLDSNTVICCNMDELQPSESQEARGRKRVDLAELKATYAGLNLEAQEICPAFADFEFTNWNREGDSQVSFLDKLVSGGAGPAISEHAFDLDAEVEPIPDSQSTEAQSEVGEGRGFMDDYDHGMDDDDNYAASEADRSERDFCLGDGKEAQIVTNAMDNIKHGTIGNLMQILAAEPSDYSYFNSNLLRTWAGPDHWKLRPKSKDTTQIENTDKTKKPKDKKDAFVIDYSEEIDFDAHFKESRAATTLTKATLDKYSNSQTTLPEDLHYDADKLFRLFAKPKLMVKRQGKSKNVDDGVQGYDYNNENDRENFCPDIDDGGDDDNDEDNFNFTAGSNDGFNHDLTAQSSFIGTANDTALNGTLLTGEKLVDQPRKVARIDINYAKSAKRMDVKKLKSSIWNILVIPETKQEETTSQEQAETTEEPASEKDTASTAAVFGDHSFQTLVRELPGKLSKNMANNLSVPIAFVCLLHLANERTLKITSDEEMTDLQISQG